MYYPKPRNVIRRIVRILRSDNNTPKVTLPKDAVITSIFVNQTSNAVTGAGSFSLGWSGAPTALVNAFSMPTSRVGFTSAGAAAGSAVGTKLDVDRVVLSTYTAGSSTAGGEGYVIIEYFMAGAGEDLNS